MQQVTVTVILIKYNFEDNSSVYVQLKDVLYALCVVDWWCNWLGNSGEELDWVTAIVWTEYFTEEVGCICFLMLCTCLDATMMLKLLLTLLAVVFVHQHFKWLFSHPLQWYTLQFVIVIYSSSSSSPS